MKKYTVILLSLMMLFNLTACNKKTTEDTEKSVAARVNESLDKRGKRLEEAALEKKEEENSQRKSTILYTFKSPVIYPDKNFNDEKAKKLISKQKIIIANPVFTEREKIIDNNEDNPKNSEFITKQKLEKIESKLSAERSKFAEEKTSGLFAYFRLKNKIKALNVKREKTKKKLDFLVNLREKENKERVITAYRVKSIDGEEESGFIKAANLVDDLTVFIAKKYKNIDYSEIEKFTYESNPPVKVRGVYVKLPSATNPKKMEELIKLAKETDINAFVIDVKDDNGNLLFKTKTGAKYMPEVNETAPIANPKAFVQNLKDNGIYPIARIVSFKDPLYSKKHKKKALTYKSNGELFILENMYWTPAFDRDIWDYDISMGEEAADVGFLEVQFDYVRFPATSFAQDKKLDFKNAKNESKPEAIHKFLKTAHERLMKKNVYVTADIFGWLITAEDDQNIGQHWEAMANVVDYTAPMIYPSHYGRGNYGLKVPDAEPYKCIDAAIKNAIERNRNLESPAKLRPWIQDFTATWVRGHINYGPKEIKAQIQALKDNGIDEYMVWNANNTYTTEAYK